MSIEIANRTALVTGANRGIGKVIAETFLERGAAKVYAAVRDPDSAKTLVAAHGDRVETVHVDLTKPSTIADAAKAAGDVEIVVNNAGAMKMTGPLDDDVFEGLGAELEVNLLGLIHVAKAFAPVLKGNGGGAFVQLNSIASMKAFAGFGTYCASKAASYSITQSLRDLLAEQGTLVVSVHPGPIATDMADRAGMNDMADSPEKVAEGIVRALANGDFHCFPDAMAREVGEAYRGFAENVVEADLAAKR